MFGEILVKFRNNIIKDFFLNKKNKIIKIII